MVQIDGPVAGWPTALESGLVLALSGYALAQEITRSWRTVLTGVIALGVTFGALWLPPQARNLTRAAVLTLFAYAAVFADRRLWSIRREDGDYAYAFKAALHKVPELAKGIGSLSHRDYLVRFARIRDEIGSLPAPSDDWREVRNAFVDELSNRLVRMGVDPPAPLPPEEQRALKARWQELVDRQRHLFSAKCDFWLRWP